MPTGIGAAPMTHHDHPKIWANNDTAVFTLNMTVCCQWKPSLQALAANLLNLPDLKRAVLLWVGCTGWTIS